MNRLFNSTIAFLIVLWVWPVLLLTSILILILDGGPVFYIQDRIGKNFQPFRIVKFKSMVNGNVTRLGKFLRSFGIDELPQLWNILKGDMNFIGPRPLTLQDIDRLGWKHPYYELRWKILPGLTGPSQLTLKCHKKITWLYDRNYVVQRSFWLDVKLMLASVGVVFIGKSKLQKYLERTKRLN